MITRIVEANDALYDALFQEISNAVEITVLTLEEYYKNLEKIATYVKSNKDKAYFLRLPIDEEIFEINANARTITVPSNYRSNGIAVVGDTYAETLWFRIDKYYDLQDLSLTDIRIYWELPGSNKVRGWSTPILTDIYSDSRKMLFGWVIPDLLTEQAGNITFSVSFYIADENEEGKNLYEFNTLSQTVGIKNTLNRDNATGLDKTDFDSFIARLRNSTEPGKIFIDRPIYSTLTTARDAITLLDSGNATIFVSAYTAQNGATMTYTLYHNGNKINTPVGTEARKLTTDTVINPNKTYVSLDGTVVSNPEVSSLSTYYEPGIEYTISKIGSYQCKAVAAYEGSSSAAEYSTLWVWEAPTAFTSPENAFVFANNPNGIIVNASDTENERTININWPNTSQDSIQQQAATYQAHMIVNNGKNDTTIVIDKSNNTYIIPANTFDGLGKGTITAYFTKTLNNESPIKNSNGETKLSIQSPAIAYDANNISFNTTEIILQGSTKLEATLKADGFNDEQTYSYAWAQATTADGKYQDITKEPIAIKIPQEDLVLEANFSKAGYYKLRIYAKYENDTKVTDSTVSALVASI